MEVVDPLRLWIDADASDEEFNLLWQRQKLIDQICAGTISPEAIPDHLLSHGENPDDWIASAISNVQRVIDSGIVPVDVGQWERLT